MKFIKVKQKGVDNFVYINADKIVTFGTLSSDVGSYIYLLEDNEGYCREVTQNVEEILELLK